MGCGSSASSNRPYIIKILNDTGVLSPNAGNLSMFGGAAMSYDEDNKTMYLAGQKGMVVMDTIKAFSDGPKTTFDLTDPQKGEVISTGAISEDGGCAFARVDGTPILFLAGGKGLMPIDVSDPKKPVLGKLIDTGALSRNGGAALALNGSTLYVAGGYGLVAFDVTNPKEPQKVGNVIDTSALLESGGVALCVHCPGAGGAGAAGGDGSYLYAAGGKGLATLDISDPQNPKKVGETTDTGVIPQSSNKQDVWSSGAALAVNGTYLYVLGGKGLRVLDISKPEAPAKVGEVIDTGSTGYSSGAALAVFESGGKLLTAGGQGLTVLDVSNAKEPKKIESSVKTGVMSDCGPASLMVSGPVTYLAGGNGLAILDNSQISALSPP